MRRLIAALLLCAAPAVHAGAQKYEALSASAQAVLHKAVSDSRPAVSSFKSPIEAVDWLGEMSRRLERRWPGLLNWPVAPGRVLTVMVCAASLFLFNRNSHWDTAGIYFFGAYGLGMLAFWAANSARRAQWRRRRSACRRCR